MIDDSGRECLHYVVGAGGVKTKRPFDGVEIIVHHTWEGEGDAAVLVREVRTAADDKIFVTTKLVVDGDVLTLTATSAKGSTMSRRFRRVPAK